MTLRVGKDPFANKRNKKTSKLRSLHGNIPNMRRCLHIYDRDDTFAVISRNCDRIVTKENLDKWRHFAEKVTTNREAEMIRKGRCVV